MEETVNSLKNMSFAAALSLLLAYPLTAQQRPVVYRYAVAQIVRVDPDGSGTLEIMINFNAAAYNFVSCRKIRVQGRDTTEVTGRHPENRYDPGCKYLAQRMMQVWNPGGAERGDSALVNSVSVLRVDGNGGMRIVIRAESIEYVDARMPFLLGLLQAYIGGPLQYIPTLPRPLSVPVQQGRPR